MSDSNTIVSRTVILNRENIEPGSNNTKLTFRFNSTIQLKKGDKIGLASLNVFNSWYNVNGSLYNNNVFIYKWFNSSGGVLNQNFNIIIADGYYSADSLQLYLESQMFLNGHYLFNQKTALNEFFISIKENYTAYKFQLYLTPIPNTLLDVDGSIKYIKTGSWGLPSTPRTSQVIFSDLYKTRLLLGFNSGSYPSTAQSSPWSALSDNTPQIHPVSSIMLKCNLCKNNVINPSDILYTFTSYGTDFGEMINDKPGNILYLDTLIGFFDTMTIEFVDQQFKRMEILDPDINVMLSLLTGE